MEFHVSTRMSATNMATYQFYIWVETKLQTESEKKTTSLVTTLLPRTSS